MNRPMGTGVCPLSLSKQAPDLDLRSYRLIDGTPVGTERLDICFGSIADASGPSGEVSEGPCARHQHRHRHRTQGGSFEGQRAGPPMMALAFTRIACL